MDIVKTIVYVVLCITIIILWGRLVVFAPDFLKWRKLSGIKGKRDAKQRAKYTFTEYFTLNYVSSSGQSEWVQPDTISLHILTLYDEVRRSLKTDGKWIREKAFYKNIYINCRYAILNRFFMTPWPNDGKNSMTPQIRSIIEEKCQMADPLSDDDMRRYYHLNPSVWEYRYNLLKKNFSIAGADAFFDGIRCLGDHLTAITAIRKVYYDLHEEMAGHDPVLSLRFYLLYYYNAFRLSRPLNIKRANRKRLFRDAHQQQQFGKLCEEIKADKGKLNEVLGKVASIYVRERKKLSLDVDGIKEADQKQARIAETLGAYLADEETPNADGRPVQQQPEAPGGMPQDVTDATAELIALFKCNEFYLDKQKVNIFAQAKGVMPGQLIESVNEKYYDILDDVLIEEGDSSYTIERDYYEQIIVQNGR